MDYEILEQRIQDLEDFIHKPLLKSHEVRIAELEEHILETKTTGVEDSTHEYGLKHLQVQFDELLVRVVELETARTTTVSEGESTLVLCPHCKKQGDKSDSGPYAWTCMTTLCPVIRYRPAVNPNPYG